MLCCQIFKAYWEDLCQGSFQAKPNPNNPSKHNLNHHSHRLSQTLILLLPLQDQTQPKLRMLYLEHYKG